MSDTDRVWAGRRVLVTGCTGFLGGWAVRELLARGAAVAGLVRDRAAAGRFARHGLAGRVYPVHGRVEDTFRLHTALAVHEVSAVFHLATDPTGRGAETVLDVVRRYDPRVPVVTARPAGAEHAVPTTPYPIPFGVALLGEVFDGELRASSSGDESRDYVYAPDAARALVRLAEVLLGGSEPSPVVAEFRSGWELTPDELAAARRDAAAGRMVNPPGGPSSHPFGWSPAYHFADALSEIVAPDRATAGPVRRAA